MIESIELFYFSITNYTQRMKRQIADPFFLQTWLTVVDSMVIYWLENSKKEGAIKGVQGFEAAFWFISMINIDPTRLYYLGAHAGYKYLVYPLLFTTLILEVELVRPKYVINVNIRAQNPIWVNHWTLRIRVLYQNWSFANCSSHFCVRFSCERKFKTQNPNLADRLLSSEVEWSMLFLCFLSLS